MYVVANRVYVKGGWQDEFETRFKKRAGQIDQQPGFVSMQVLKPESDETPYVVLTTWRDESAFNAWVGSEDFKVAHSNPMPKDAFESGGGLERYSIVVAAESN